MQQNKNQKSFGNSLSVENLNYPIIIEVPEDYWTHSKFFYFSSEYLNKENNN